MLTPELRKQISHLFQVLLRLHFPDSLASLELNMVLRFSEPILSLRIVSPSDLQVVQVFIFHPRQNHTQGMWQLA